MLDGGEERRLDRLMLRFVLDFGSESLTRQLKGTTGTCSFGAQYTVQGIGQPCTHEPSSPVNRYVWKFYLAVGFYFPSLLFSSPATQNRSTTISRKLHNVSKSGLMDMSLVRSFLREVRDLIVDLELFARSSPVRSSVPVTCRYPTRRSKKC